MCRSHIHTYIYIYFFFKWKLFEEPFVGSTLLTIFFFFFFTIEVMKRSVAEGYEVVPCPFISDPETGKVSASALISYLLWIRRKGTLIHT